MFKIFRSRNRAKIEWLQDPNQSNVDNLNSVRRVANTHFKNKKTEHPKAKINELEINWNIKKSEL